MTFNAAAFALREETKALGDYYIQYGRPLLIFKTKKSYGPVPARFSDAVEFKLSRQIPTKPSDVIFVTEENRPLKR